MALLSTELIKLNNLQLAGKLVSEELMLGIHHSKRFGYGIEFEQYKHYQAGDDPKRIDWKLYARTQKHLVRESSTESNYHLRFIIDLSGSMNYTENGVSRLQYAKILLASLAYLGYRQGDMMSLYALQNGEVQTLVSSGKESFQRILYALEKAKASGDWLNENPKFPIFQQKQKEVVIFVSDFLQINEEWLNLIKNLANPHREVMVFQVLGKQEIDFDLKGFFRFKDLETGKEVELQAESIKAEVLKNAESYLKNLTLALQIPFVYLLRTSLEDPIANVISESLKRR
ncbi:MULTISPECIES: DUF58 domain-containing protein [unclassified Arcicella]|uniref:DUF58 domain-containing protein n=1 Tax=unclassified Arcicella TaxID=2644986 RepID=UPI00286109D4|nr:MULTISPECIES: DUF58 domain-containing protein [unclassified Arcicella]MDR6562084.1 uncharacterized protein (DUF58 family) [Arcicella sp. BE51]MDR6811956.1 uncharacterized protein (DUF58 family) [Arcicella sp. BE140]MDR6822986.1 uncharacterized protein (DUF58 family) [Arcicella sp. BE139]